MSDSTYDRLDRPASLRREPRPAPDEDVDPVQYVPPAPDERVDPVQRVSPVLSASTSPAVSATAGRRGRRRELTIQFSAKLSPEVVAVIDDVVAQEGITIRAAVEEAIANYWGPRLKS